jgi:DNA-binding ferritin-like protein
MPSKTKRRGKFESSGKLRKNPSSMTSYNKSRSSSKKSSSNSSKSKSSYLNSNLESKSSSSYSKDNEKNKYSIENIIKIMLQLLNNIKIYHWNTFSYPQHKATDELYSSLGDNIDKFVEVLLGKTNRRINLNYIQEIKIYNIKNKNELINSIEKYKLFLNKMSYHKLFTPDLLTIRDEILADLNQFLYLLTLE